MYCGTHHLRLSSVAEFFWSIVYLFDVLVQLHLGDIAEVRSFRQILV